MAYNMTTSTLSTIPLLVSTYLPKSLHPFLLLSYPIPSHPIPTHTHTHTHSRTYDAIFRSTVASALGTGKGAGTASGGSGGLSKLTLLYDKGPKDLYFVFSWCIIFTLLRSFTMIYVFQPFANHILTKESKNGIIKESKKDKKKRHHNVTRFSEQAWSWLYCSIFWTLGMFTLYSIPNPTSPEQLWGTYPYTPLPALTKFYYLAQLGWWFHQIYVINTEKRRKDHWQMFGHHVLTIILIVTSYMANFTRVGVLIHVLMDFCDIWLPLAKMLRYLSFSFVCDLTFVVFLVSWLFSREIGLFLVMRTSFYDAPRFIKFQWSPSTGNYLTYTTYLGFIGLVTFLWILASIWFYMACRVAIKVVKGEGAEDSRSDDEDENENENEDEADSSTTSTTSSTSTPTIHISNELLDEIPQSVGTSTTTALKMNGSANHNQTQQNFRKR
ncbi:uncharacterized protein IL334_003920 [Kwoniella shivajii]|uniref:TLC domain-containing protein n=1 Tax=Kwoniella shivajii TaxID=564305 RepID=A0ABZ1CYX5_9TREE|nr:hypothetical protein IL334_003920 [Kwoniella shivajii]